MNGNGGENALVSGKEDKMSLAGSNTSSWERVRTEWTAGANVPCGE